MSLHKVKKSRCWHLAFRDETGKRTLRSTGESVLRRAKIKADAMLRIAEDARAGLTDRRFLLRTVDDTLRRLGHTIDEPTLWQFLNQWLSDIKAQVSESTYDRYSVVVRLFSDSVGFKKLTDVNSADFVRFRDKMLAEGRSAATVNLMLRGILRQPFRIAFNSGLISSNPAALVKPLKRAQTGRQVFTPEQIQILLAGKLSDDWRGLILAGFYTGQRLGDLSNLKWSNVSLTTHLIRIEQRKTGTQVEIPIHLRLGEWLAEAQVRHSQVFPTLAGRPTCTLSTEFKRILEKSGIEVERRAKRGKGRSTSSLSFHSLRHSFSSAFANAQVSIEIRQKLTGHASKEMQLHYTHHEVELFREAIAKLPSI